MKTDLKELLSQTEIKIIALLEQGLSNRMISNKCNVSINTVKFHLKNIYKKLEVHSRIEAIYKINNN